VQAQLINDCVILQLTVRSREFCWNYSTRWMALIRLSTSR